MAKKVGAVMVVGAGIAGIQASLDLANNGFRVYLVDRAPAIGGKMAQLDKTFPTCDCSLCIESPKFVECDRHPNVDIITYTEVDRVEGEPGDFKVTLMHKPRYVDAEVCKGCGTCTQYCPVMIPDAYNADLGYSKSIHRHFSQAVPLSSHIDPETCLFLLEKKCNICRQVCQKNAIDFNQQPVREEVAVGAIIVSPGYEPFDPSIRGDFGYGRMRNVVTALEYERMLSASGPHRGEIVRPSDGKPPKKIAWIQCVGSRQVTPGGNSYCSAVCCMYTTKQAILTKDHEPHMDITIFHNGIRAFGKDFERFRQRAEAMPGTHFVRSYVSVGHEIPETNNITIKYSLEDNGVKEEEFDLVVLSIGLQQAKGVKDLAGKLAIELDEHGFCHSTTAEPVETSRPGIYASGAFLRPMDIPDSVVTGSAAAARAIELLSPARGSLAREKHHPEERDVREEEPRVGVFVCRCGTNIGRVVNVPEVVQYSSTLPNVVYAQEQLFSCASDSTREIAEKIEEHKLNRVVVAACTPRTHERLFQDTLREGGINEYLFDLANIREHCSWVHAREGERATDKAKDLVRMSVARTALLQPLKELEVPVTKKALVVGGGLAGMTSSLSLADQGFEVHLVEKENDLGGNARRVHYTLDGTDVQAYVKRVVRSVYENPLVHVHTASSVVDTSGYAGNFNTKIVTGSRQRDIRSGVIILATGAEEYKPAEFLYGENDHVLTLLDLEGRVANGDPSVKSAKSLAMILCVGCREGDKNYCSRVCCGQAIKVALALKEINPQLEIDIFHRDIMTYGLQELHYREAAMKGVRFIRFAVDDKPVVEAIAAGEGALRVTALDRVLGEKLAIEVDLLALAAAVVPSSTNPEVSRLFRAPLSSDGFFLEAHPKLRPVEFATNGVFLCGMAQYPKTIDETVSQAYAAASRASAILSKDRIVSSAVVSSVEEDKCTSCRLCHKFCQYGAVELYDTDRGEKAKVIPTLCEGCGLCNAKCPSDAITLSHFSDAQVLAEIDAAFTAPVKPGHFEPRILAFLCNWCGYAGADLAGVSRIQYAPNIRIVRVLCSGRIPAGFVYHAFDQGADGVMICGCHIGGCHYIDANLQTDKMVLNAKRRLEKMGVDPQRLYQDYISAAEGGKFAQVVNAFTAQVTKLGPCELKRKPSAPLVGAGV